MSWLDFLTIQNNPEQASRQKRPKEMLMRRLVYTISVLFLTSIAFAASREGYYMYPAIHGKTIVFTAEGDLWSVGIEGGTATRLTSARGIESHASISPDGKMIAFSAQYEGPTEVYTMPIDGGLPVRRTYEGEAAIVVGWTPGGQVMYSTRFFSTLPNVQLATINLKTDQKTLIPLEQASNGVYTESGDTLFFTRFPFQGSHTKRYKGGTAQNIWRYIKGQPEATPLTADYAGTSKDPMLGGGRVYFASDRDGTMNIWSMDMNGRKLRQETFHSGFDIVSPSLSDGRIAYHEGADIYVYNIATKKDRLVPIQLSSDFDQEVTQWVKHPMKYLTSAHISPKGNRIALTARGEVFVAPVSVGRLVEVTRKSGVRYRNARFMPEGKTLELQSDESGYQEFWTYPANGVGKGEQLTHEGMGFRNEGVPSPDGKFLAYTDRRHRLLIFDIAEKRLTVVGTSDWGGYGNLKWSPDSRWLAYTRPDPNTYEQLMVYNLSRDSSYALTDDRVNSYSPAWSLDGKWLYFLSDRTFHSLVSSPWGPDQPEPFFDKTTDIYAIALEKGERFPFAPPNELTDTSEPALQKAGRVKEKGKSESAGVTIDFSGIQSRTYQVPVPAGRYQNLSMNDKALFIVEGAGESSDQPKLEAIAIGNKEVAPKTLIKGVGRYELSDNGKKLMAMKGSAIYVIDASANPPAALQKDAVNLKNWTFSFNPKEEWRQMFVDAWRLEQDYFYDPNLQGVNYEATLKRYLPLVSRITDREELNDLIGQIVGELSALHTFVVGGDIRKPTYDISVGSLGAILSRDEAAGGFKITHIFRADPNYLNVVSPLARPGLNIEEGDVITAINGVATLYAPSPDKLLENQVGRQVLLEMKSGKTGKEFRQVVVPISQNQFANLRYSQWEYDRRIIVDKESHDEIGYVHLRAMGTSDFSQWVRDYYPVFNREGLIIDVRDNRGGNIDSWILEKLIRKAWMYWKPRDEKPFWNMQYAFRGYIVVLCNQFTASDGEAFTEGFKRLHLGKVIGMRTWGGEIWLSFDNGLLDGGIASAAELGVYGPGGHWLIEGHGVNPDIVVDDTPHETFEGHDAQLQEAIKYLMTQIKEHPVTTPPPPPYPIKAFNYNK